jgi:hypothetical protein
MVSRAIWSTAKMASTVPTWMKCLIVWLPVQQILQQETREDCGVSCQHHNAGGQCNVKVSVTKVMSYEEKYCVIYKLVF